VADAIPEYAEGDFLDLDTENALIRGHNDHERRLSITEAKQLRYAKTPAGGIASGSGSSATCTHAGRNPTTGGMIDSDATLKVWNIPNGGTVAGSIYIIVGLVNGMWTVLVEPC
jgi:hypothetical protein